MYNRKNCTLKAPNTLITHGFRSFLLFLNDEVKKTFFDYCKLTQTAGTTAFCFIYLLVFVYLKYVEITTCLYTHQDLNR